MYSQVRYCHAQSLLRCKAFQALLCFIYFFFQLCLYLTVWLAEDCHFGPNVICGPPMTKICILGAGGEKMPTLGVTNAKIK